MNKTDGIKRKECFGFFSFKLIFIIKFNYSILLIIFVFGSKLDLQLLNFYTTQIQ